MNSNWKYIAPSSHCDFRPHGANVNVPTNWIHCDLKCYYNALIITLLIKTLQTDVQQEVRKRRSACLVFVAPSLSQLYPSFALNHINCFHSILWSSVVKTSPIMYSNLSTRRWIFIFGLCCGSSLFRLDGKTMKDSLTFCAVVMILVSLLVCNQKTVFCETAELWSFHCAMFLVNLFVICNIVAIIMCSVMWICT